jgi:hypothetical protein
MESQTVDLMLFFVAGISILVGIIYSNLIKRIDKLNGKIETLELRLISLDKQAISKGYLKDSLSPIETQLSMLVELNDKWSSECGKTCLAAKTILKQC